MHDIGTAKTCLGIEKILFGRFNLKSWHDLHHWATNFGWKGKCIKKLARYFYQNLIKVLTQKEVFFIDIFALRVAMWDCLSRWLSVIRGRLCYNRGFEGGVISIDGILLAVAAGWVVSSKLMSKISLQIRWHKIVHSRVVLHTDGVDATSLNVVEWLTSLISGWQSFVRSAWVDRHGRLLLHLRRQKSSRRMWVVSKANAHFGCNVCLAHVECEVATACLSHCCRLPNDIRTSKICETSFLTIQNRHLPWEVKPRYSGVHH